MIDLKVHLTLRSIFILFVKYINARKSQGILGDWMIYSIKIIGSDEKQLTHRYTENIQK